jgi:protein involved in polysaccharide export with SLBB domain
MIRFKLFGVLVSVIIFSHGCTKILEPISLNNSESSVLDNQEEFSINIQGLTFESALKANQDPYPRQIMVNGSGSKANVFNEADFLSSNIPPKYDYSGYILGPGDELIYNSLNEFIYPSPQWPAELKFSEYNLGVGDELTFSQLSEAENISVNFDQETSGIKSGKKEEEKLLITTGVIGSNGNILLLGMGNIQAAGRGLNDVRNEVRNILIRNGHTPNFQLDITDFKSKRAYVAHNVTGNIVIPITNIPLSLKEACLLSGLSSTEKNLATVTLRRDKKEFKLTAQQLFEPNAPEIYITNKDEIIIEIIKSIDEKIYMTVGSTGNILIPGVGNLMAANRTLDDLQSEVREILTRKRISPNFQLELSGFSNQNAYLIRKDVGSKIIPITDTRVSLRQIIFSYKSANGFVTSNKQLSIVTLKRDNKSYRLTLDKILDPMTPDIWIQNEDQIEIEDLSYKSGQVFALSGAGNASIVPIDPSVRETLANVLFEKNGPLDNLSAKRSEIYLLRGRKQAVAYHLDAQNVSRILVAAKTELRPNDIIYVADRPIISFARVLSEIAPLRILLRDIQDNNIP